MTTSFTSDDSLVLLIDHQVGVLQWVVQSPPRELVTQNALKLANAAEILDIPLLISTNQEEVNGPLIPELVAAAPTPHENRIQRTGTVDALAEPAFAIAVEATGRRKLILAGIGSDVCAVFPTLHALEDGYEVQLVADACGTNSELSHQIALRRMEQAGAALTTTASILAELAISFATEQGAQILALMQGRPHTAAGAA